MLCPASDNYGGAGNGGRQRAHGGRAEIHSLNCMIGSDHDPTGGSDSQASNEQSVLPWILVILIVQQHLPLRYVERHGCSLIIGRHPQRRREDGVTAAFLGFGSGKSSMALGLEDGGEGAL